MRISEINLSAQTYFHGSSTPVEPGTIMKGGHSYWNHGWRNDEYNKIVEKYRPPNMISREKGIFMVLDEEDIDNAGGDTSYILTLLPLDQMERHDIGWLTQIDIDLSNNEPEEKLKKDAENYWNGIEHPTGVWEYITTQAEVISCEQY